MENLFSIAKQMAADIPDSEKDKLQGMDMQAMIQHVTQNVVTMMNDPDALKNNPLLAMASQEMNIPNTSETFKDHPSSKKTRKHKHRVEDIADDDDDGESILPKTKDLHFSINVSLEDLYRGKSKKIAVNRKRLKKVKDKQGKSKYESHIEKKTITIPILPGTCDGHVITFEGEADELSGHKPGNIIITINENEHEIFERDGDNLLIVKDISLSESFGFSYKIQHLDGHILKINSDLEDILHLNDGVRKLEGEGMPILEKDFDREEEEEEDNTKKFGDLFMRFNLVLPEKVDKKYIETIKKIFPPLEDGIIKNVDVTEDSTIVEKVLKTLTEEDIENLGTGYDSDDFSDSDDSEDDSDYEEESDESEEESDESEEESETLD